MKTESVLLAVTKSERSFIFTSLAIASPYFLASFHISVVLISAFVLGSLAISTAYLYLFIQLPLKTKDKLVLLALLLFVSMLVLFLFETPIALLAAVIIGAVSLGGRDLTANQSLEQYTLSVAEEEQRRKNLAFGVYNFGLYAGGAAASAVLIKIGGSHYPFLFLLLTVLSSLQLLTYLLLPFPSATLPPKKSMPSSEIGKVARLSALFALDALGGGLVNTSMITLWFKVVYNIPLSSAGLIFVIVNVITAISVIASGYISGGFGLVRTMVYTHLISNALLFLIPVIHSLFISELFLYLRQSTSQMDVPARDSFVNTYIPKEARVSANSTFAAVRNGCQIPGPGIAGLLLETFPSALFFGASLMKVAYDILFFANYRGTGL
ncbi:MAG: hypothetical protein QXP70_00940 [Methanomassiliicoccales archaeon]